MNVYIITGASRGLGKSFVENLETQHNNFIYSLSRTKGTGEPQENVKFIEIDLNHSQDIEQVINQIFSNFTMEHVTSITLINNAGTIHPIKKIADCTPEEIEMSIHVNLVSPMLLTSKFLQKTAAWDVPKYVVNISSGAANRPVYGWSTYCTSKAGLDMFTKTAALEQEEQPYPAKIVSMAPGVVDTSMQSEIRSADVEDFRDLEKFQQYKENGHLLDPSVVANKILDLIPSNLLINGKNYHINDFL